MSQNREPFGNRVMYWMLKWGAVEPLFRIYFRGRFHGKDNLVRRGPVLVVSNHASYFDPPLLSTCMRRPVAYMAKQELFDVPLLGPAIRAYGAYPVSRGTGDRSAIDATLKRLEKDWAVGIFLQGTRTRDARISSPKLGAALIAARAQVPLLPVSLWGTQHILGKGLPRPAPVTVRVGQLILPPESSDREELTAVTQRCTDAIHAMHDLGR
ncbi:MAG: lysophospholipid acyltransferase family protein [Elainellaceae cyanobacterium]